MCRYDQSEARRPELIVIQDNETHQMLSRGYYTANTRTAFSENLSKITERKHLDIWREKSLTLGLTEVMTHVTCGYDTLSLWVM